MDASEVIRAYYDEDVTKEWERLDRHKVEFEINKRYLSRYIHPGDRVLDMGGGPGRYALFLAEMGCEVTLADLSSKNVEFALAMAQQRNLPLRGMCLDARYPHDLNGEQFDHVLLMGPLYHLLEEADREQAIRASLDLLKPGGMLAVAFISSYGGIIYSMKYEPLQILDPVVMPFYELFAADKEFSGASFTLSHFIRHADILPFMGKFPLQKLHLLGSESILGPCEPNILSQAPEVVAAWIDLAERVAEREDLLSYAEHYLYLGRKTL